MIYCNEVNSILKQFMSLSSILTLSYQDYRKIIRTLFKVKCDIASASEMNKVLNFILPSDRIKIRDKIRNDKNFTDYVYKIRTLINKGHKISYLDCKDMQTLKDMPEPLNDNQIGKYCEKTLNGLYAYIKYMASKKLGKLLKVSNEIDYEDVVSKIYLVAYDECRNAVMSKRGEYLTNYLKLKINSALLNTLSFYTSDKRSVTTKNESSEYGSPSYVKRVVNETQVNQDDESLDIFNSIADVSAYTTIEQSDIRSDLINKLKALSKDNLTSAELVSKKVIEIVLNKSKDFITFCNKIYNCTFNDALDILETCGKTKFLNLIKKYLNIPLDKIKLYSKTVSEMI